MSILLTGVGGDIAQAAAMILREAYPSWHLTGSDVAVRHAGGLYVDELLISPRADDKSYVAWINEQSSSHNFCWALSEAEISALSHSEVKNGERFISPGDLVVHAGNDKYMTALLLSELGLNGPWTRLSISELKAGDFPCIYKPRSGSGSKALFTCKSIREAALISETFPGGVFQELLLPADREVTCAVYRTRDGRVAVLPLLRQLAGGLTSWAQVIEEPEVCRVCTALAEALNLHGSMNVQLRLTESGPRVFEINARLSSTCLIRHRMGFRDAIWSVQEMLGERVELYAPKSGVIGVRTFGATLVSDN